MKGIATARSMLLATAAFTLATSAGAQTGAGGETKPAASGAAGPTDSETSANAIVVTARRVEERLQDVPISITVFSQAQLANRNVFSAPDLATYTPSLSVSTRYGPDQASFAIRGFSQEARTTPSVGTYFADVVVPRGGAGSVQGGDVALPGMFFDLQNVQVLKGPQGTLFGRNTTGGAVLLVPRKPTSTFEGYVEGSLGNYDMRRIQAVLNVPLSSAARLRMGVDWQKRDGYLKNLLNIGPDALADIDYIAARASLVVDLDANLENYTIGQYTKTEPAGTVAKVTDCFPTTATGAAVIVGQLSCAQITREAGGGFYAVENTLPTAVQRNQTWQLINTTTWRASDQLTVKNIASYAELETFQRNDLFGAVWLIPSGTFAGRLANFAVNVSPPSSLSGGKTQDQSTFTEEFQVQGRSADNRLDGQAGFYYEQSDPKTFYGQLAGTNISCDDLRSFRCTNVASALGGRTAALAFSIGKTRYRDVGLYVQGTYALSDKLKATGGVRYTWDKSSATAQRTTTRFVGTALTSFCTSVLAGPPITVPVASPLQCQEKFRAKSDAPTWTVSLDYKPSEAALLYAKYSRGYRQGSVSPFSAEGFTTFGPEKVDAYEVGAKTSFDGAISATFNIAGFYNELSNQQLLIGLRSSANLANPGSSILNAGKSRIYGVEVENTLSPFRGFSLNTSYAYLNTKLKSLQQINIVPGSLLDTIATTPLVGGPLPLTPRHKISVNATYELPLPSEIGRVSVGATYTYRSRIFTAQPDAASLALLVPRGLGDIGYIRSVGLTNFNVNWSDVAGRPIDLSFFMTNAFDKNYYTGHNVQVTSGFISRYLGEPRTFGFRLRYRFRS